MQAQTRAQNGAARKDCGGMWQLRNSRKGAKCAKEEEPGKKRSLLRFPVCRAATSRRRQRTQQVGVRNFRVESSCDDRWIRAVLESSEVAAEMSAVHDDRGA